MLPCIITHNTITVFLEKKPFTIDNTHSNFEAVEDALKSGKTEKQILELMDVAKAVTNFANATEITKGKVKIQDGEIFYMNEKVHSSLATRIIALMNGGFDITPFTNFMENLYQNPSFRAVNETYDFLEACNLPITEDGNIIMYKKVNADYTDCYTGTIDNSIGQVVSMPRNKVNEDKNQTCSTGLHACSWDYLKSYTGARTMILCVNPKSIVSVPVDYNNAKIRVCEYKVIGEIDNCDPNKKLEENVISDKDLTKLSLNITL